MRLQSSMGAYEETFFTLLFTVYFFSVIKKQRYIKYHQRYTSSGLFKAPYTLLYCLADLFNQTSFRFFWEAPSHALRLFLHTYPPMSIVRYSFIQGCELEQCGVNKLPKVRLVVGSGKRFASHPFFGGHVDVSFNSYTQTS